MPGKNQNQSQLTQLPTDSHVRKGPADPKLHLFESDDEHNNKVKKRLKGVSHLIITLHNDLCPDFWQISFLINPAQKSGTTQQISREPSPAYASTYLLGPLDENNSSNVNVTLCVRKQSVARR